MWTPKASALASVSAIFSSIVSASLNWWAAAAWGAVAGSACSARPGAASSTRPAASRTEPTVDEPFVVMNFLRCLSSVRGPAAGPRGRLLGDPGDLGALDADPG